MSNRRKSNSVYRDESSPLVAAVANRLTMQDFEIETNGHVHQVVVMATKQADGVESAITLYFSQIEPVIEALREYVAGRRGPFLLGTRADIDKVRAAMESQ